MFPFARGSASALSFSLTPSPGGRSVAVALRKNRLRVRRAPALVAPAPDGVMDGAEMGAARLLGSTSPTVESGA
jgi:hypothetical protein